MKSVNEQFLQYRLLAFKFGGRDASDFPLDLDDALALVEAGEVKAGPHFQEFRNVCAKLPVSLVDRLDETLRMLDMTKRDFIEMAITEALDKVDGIAKEVNVREFDKPVQEVAA